ncbi:MAG TPA: transglycosylase SLT domain-containing protein [Candidatus Aquicultor sp.]|jgi:peptidoglycan hydrolase CwlO-like protein
MVAFRTLYKTRVLIVSTLTLLLLAPTAFASQLDNQRAKLESLNAQIKATEAKQNNAAKRQAHVLRQIQTSNQKMVNVQRQLNTLQTQLNTMIAKKHDIDAELKATQEKLDQTEAELADAQARLVLKRQVYNKRLINAYKTKNLSIVSVILGSQNFSDLMDRMTFVGLIAQSDSRNVFTIKQLTAKISGEIAQVTATKNAVNKQRGLLLAEEQRISGKKSRIIVAQKQLVVETRNQQKLYAQIQKEKKLLAQAASSLKASSSVVAGQIGTLENQLATGSISRGGMAKAANLADLTAIATQAANKYGIPTKLFFALIRQESGWNYRAASSASAVGLTQIMPFNVTAMGYNLESFKNSPSDQLEAGAYYLSMQYKTFNRWDYALAAYNAGAGAVMMYGGIPPYSETRNYVRNIMSMAGM